jgi:hypothetical protein
VYSGTAPSRTYCPSPSITLKGLIKSSGVVVWDSRVRGLEMNPEVTIIKIR